MKEQGEYQQDLKTIRDELEVWRLSIPLVFRPGERFARTSFTSSASVMAALRTHLVYHNFVMVLCRLRMKLSEPPCGALFQNARDTFMSSARRVIELTGHVELESYTPSVCVSAFNTGFLHELADMKQALDGDSLVCIPQSISLSG